MELKFLSTHVQRDNRIKQWDSFCSFIYIHFSEIGRENDIEKNLVTPGFKPLCARLLDYKKASFTTQQPRIVYIPISPLPESFTTLGSVL